MAISNWSKQYRAIGRSYTIDHNSRLCQYAIDNHKQAIYYFLSNITIRVHCVGIVNPFDDHPSWSAFKYSVSLVKNGNTLINFEYTGSVHDFNNNKHPSAYDLICCVNCDSSLGDETLEDFLDMVDSGAPISEYPKAIECYQQCQRLNSALQSTFDSDTLELIRKII